MPRNSFDNSLGRFTAVKDIAKVYSLKPKYEDVLEENASKHVLTNLKKINKIDRAFSLLADPYRTIFKNTFLEKRECYWWVDFYSKTTYYRLRNKAIRSFLEAYNS